jgi:hypothetical protein
MSLSNATTVIKKYFQQNKVSAETTVIIAYTPDMLTLNLETGNTHVRD